jgi:hypothetical protein
MHVVLTWPVGHDAHAPRTPAPPAAPVAAYVVGTAAGGATAAGLVAVMGRALGGADAPGLVVVALAVVVLAIALQANGRVAPLPERRAQVPRQWLLWADRRKTALAFGLMIGAMVLTHLRHASAYVLGATVVLAPSVGAGAALGAAYGMFRGMPLIVTWACDRLGRLRPDFDALVRRETEQRVRMALALVSVGTFAYVLVTQPVALLGG